MSKKRSRVHIDHHLVACFYVALGLVQRLVRAAPRAEAEARCRETRIEQGLEHLGYGLLYEAVYDRGDA